MTGAVDAKSKASGDNPNATHDKTKIPMETAMWSKMRPIMHGVQDVADGWERFGNALSPTPPFPRPRGMALFIAQSYVQAVTHPRFVLFLMATNDRPVRKGYRLDRQVRACKF